MRNRNTQVWIEIKGSLIKKPRVGGGSGCWKIVPKSVLVHRDPTPSRKQSLKQGLLYKWLILEAIPENESERS